MISDHERLALEHARILEFHKFYSEYHLWLQADGERFKVSIRVYETGSGHFFFRQSHFVRTPIHEIDGETTELSHATPHLALRTGVESVTTFYEEAVSQGHPPSADWFVDNPRF